MNNLFDARKTKRIEMELWRQKIEISEPRGELRKFRERDAKYRFFNCRLCGEKTDFNETNQVKLIPNTCDNCYAGVLKDVLKKIIPNTREFCQDCLSHYKACTCEKREALKELNE